MLPRRMFVYQINGGSAPRDDLYSLNVSGDQIPRWAQRQTPSEDPVTLDSHQERPREPVWAIQSDFAAVGIELLCRLARGEMAPRLSLVSSPRFFFSVLSPMEFWFLAAVASGLKVTRHDPNFLTCTHTAKITSLRLRFIFYVCVPEGIKYLLCPKIWECPKSLTGNSV